MLKLVSLAGYNGELVYSEGTVGVLMEVMYV